MEIIDLHKKFAAHLDADFEEYFNASKLTLNNHKGKGYINTYHIHEGLSVKIFNITFSDNQQLLNTEVDSDYIYFLYCVKGSFLHKFSEEQENANLGEMQNVILQSPLNAINLLILPANIHLKLTVITLKKDLKFNFKNRDNLFDALEGIMASINKNKSLKFYGEMNPLTRKFAEILVNNERIDAVGNLLVEAAVINTLASQIDNYNKHQNRSLDNLQLTNSELIAISNIGDYVLENIDSAINANDISSHFGLPRKKIQAGVKFLYGQTLANFIRDIKLEKAKELIHFSDFNISEICYSIGIKSKSHFSKIFSDYFGILPVKYKESLIAEDYIFELSYKSNAIPGLTSFDINNIITSARENNLKTNITGCLVFYEELFFQILEGKKEDVLKLYEYIKSDNRHYNVSLLKKKVSTKRKFSSWSMAVISDDGEVTIPLDGKPFLLNLKAVLSKDNITDHNSMLFWKRVLNIIRDTEEDKHIANVY